jgi:pimeloyl-ACP methyl ester carboxylesterase
MIKATSVGQGTNIVILPGGPGLSSNTIKAFDDFSKRFRIIYLDYCGTNNSPNTSFTFNDLVQEISAHVQKLEGKTILMGHSYGGVLASQVAVTTDCDALICLGTPFTSRSLKLASNNFASHNDEELKIAANNWSLVKSKETFNAWLAEYKELWFLKENVEFGKNLLKNDPSSFDFFLSNRNDILENSSVITNVSLWKKPKLFLAGEKDLLLPPEILELDAIEGGFSYSVISKASHFLMWDNYPEVSGKINSFILSL